MIESELEGNELLTGIFRFDGDSRRLNSGPITDTNETKDGVMALRNAQDMAGKVGAGCAWVYQDLM